MSNDIIIQRGVVKSPQAATVLEEILLADPRIEGVLIFGRPIAPLITPEGNDETHACADACLVSPRGHVTVFDLIDGPEPGDHVLRQRQALHPVLHKLDLLFDATAPGRKFPMDLHPATFGPNLRVIEVEPDPPYFPYHPVLNAENLADVVAGLQGSAQGGRSQAVTLQVLNFVSRYPGYI